MSDYNLVNNDCLDILPEIPDNSIDMVLADLPYGITENDWDQELSLEKLWDEYKRLTTETAVIALTASQPFTSELVLSNKEMFRHEWIWEKNRGSNFANTVREPFKEHEQVLIFSEGNWTYNKQMEKRNGSGAERVEYDLNQVSESDNYREFDREQNNRGELRVPSSIQKFNVVNQPDHPTQKPVALFEYLIKTYTNEGDIVLDNVMGSGTTGVACQKTDRRFLGIEQDEEYFEIAQDRIEEAKHTDWERVEGIEEWQEFEGIGEKTAEDLYDELGNVDNADMDSLESVSGVGQKTAESIREERVRNS